MPFPAVTTMPSIRRAHPNGVRILVAGGGRAFLRRASAQACHGLVGMAHVADPRLLPHAIARGTPHMLLLSLDVAKAEPRHGPGLARAHPRLPVLVFAPRRDAAAVEALAAASWGAVGLAAEEDLLHDNRLRKVIVEILRMDARDDPANG